MPQRNLLRILVDHLYILLGTTLFGLFLCSILYLVALNIYP